MAKKIGHGQLAMIRVFLEYLADFLEVDPDYAETLMKGHYCMVRGYQYFRLEDLSSRQAEEFLLFLIDFCRKCEIPFCPRTAGDYYLTQ